MNYNINWRSNFYFRWVNPETSEVEEYLFIRGAIDSQKNNWFRVMKRSTEDGIFRLYNELALGNSLW